MVVWGGIHFVNHCHFPYVVYYCSRKKWSIQTWSTTPIVNLLKCLGIMFVHLGCSCGILVWVCYVESCSFSNSTLDHLGEGSRFGKDSLFPFNDLSMRLPHLGDSPIDAWDTFGKLLGIWGHVKLSISFEVFGSNDETTSYDVLWILGPIYVLSNFTSRLKTIFLVLGLYS